MPVVGTEKKKLKLRVFDWTIQYWNFNFYDIRKNEANGSHLRKGLLRGVRGVFILFIVTFSFLLT